MPRFSLTPNAHGSREIQGGTNPARRSAMSIAHRFEELVCWQLSVDLRDRVFQLLDHDRVRKNDDFYNQTSSAAASAPRNLSEGFSRYKPRQFAYLTRVALASLAETRNQLLEGVRRGYWTIDQVRDLLFLEYRARKATTGLLAYLDSCDGTAPADWNTSGPPSDGKPSS
jgi:four helix bundle protein